jgi:hypothetical protein
MNISTVRTTLKDQGVPADRLEAASQAIIDNLPAETYNSAILFLGAVTLLLALGAVLLPAFGKEVVDALWGALGAGIGGLAGIFMAKS